MSGITMLRPDGSTQSTPFVNGQLVPMQPNAASVTNAAPAAAKQDAVAKDALGRASQPAAAPNGTLATTDYSKQTLG